jgi:hypothetical protein
MYFVTNIMVTQMFFFPNAYVPNSPCLSDGTKNPYIAAYMVEFNRAVINPHTIRSQFRHQLTFVHFKIF